MKYRIKVWKAAEASDEFRSECRERCRDSFVWYCDTFLWTHNPKQYPEHPHRPLILREYQEEFSDLLIRSIGEHDVLAAKSRDMGGTTVPLAVLLWLWHFYPNFTAILGSSKQEYVDKKGNDKCLFWKMDAMLARMPWWLRPPVRPKVDRIENTLINPINESSITGEATNPNFGRGSRPAVILLDEFASVDFAYAVLSATGEATNTRWFISTFEGAFGAFYERWKKMSAETPERVYSMHWSKHPEKSKGLYTSTLVNDKFELQILDKNYKFPEGYKYTLDGKLRSVFYDDYCRNKAGSPQEVAQQLDMQPQEAGFQFMSTSTCQEIAAKHARRPVARGEFVFDNATTGEVRFIEKSDGAVWLWANLTPTGQYSGNQDVAAGCDIATGTSATKGSNSVACFYGSTSKEKLCQITTDKMLPHQFARYVVAACRFFTGPNGTALLNWEDNGPGQVFRVSLLQELRYLRLWMSSDNRKPNAPKSKVPGWRSDVDSKKLLLNQYKTALLEDKIINRCHDAIMECAEYVNQVRGDRMVIEHCKALQTKDKNSSGELHGDMVIADAIAYLAISDLPENIVLDKPSVPELSWMGRRKLWEQKHKSAKGSW